MLRGDVQHPSGVAGNPVVRVLPFVHLQADHTVREVQHKVHTRPLLVDLAAEGHRGLALEGHVCLREEPRDLLLALLLALLASLGVDGALVHG